MRTLFEERLKAARSGAKQYRTAYPCPANHSPFRYTSTGGCVECAKEKAAAAYRRKKKTLQQVHP